MDVFQLEDDFEKFYLLTLQELNDREALGFLRRPFTPSIFRVTHHSICIFGNILVQ